MAKKMLIFAISIIMLFGVLGLTACGKSLDDYKTAKTTELQAYANAKGQYNYSEDGWAAICKAVADGKQAIENAATKATVTTAYNDALAAIDAVERIVKIAAIHYFITENWVFWQDHKYYDFVNMTYSTKKIQIGYDGGKPFVIIDAEYEVKATFTEQQINVFFDNIIENGIFNLDEYYHENAEDGDSWDLIITLNDGTIFESSGYMKYPPQKDAFDEAFMALTGYRLFTSLWIDNQ